MCFMVDPACGVSKKEGIKILDKSSLLLKICSVFLPPVCYLQDCVTLCLRILVFH